MKGLSSRDPELRKSLKGGLWPKASSERRAHRAAGAGAYIWVENGKFRNLVRGDNATNGVRRKKEESTNKA